MIGQGLAYVALVATDVDAVAATLARALGLTRTDGAAGPGGGRVPVFPIGASALALLEPGDPFVDGETRPGVHHIGIEVPDLALAGRAVEASGLRVRATAPGLWGTARLLLDPDGTAGVRTSLVEPLPLDRPGSRELERIDHVGVASADNRAALEAFVKRLGHPLESTQTDVEVQIAVETFTSDRYGAIYHSRSPVLAGGLRVAFVTVGDCDLEFLQDFASGADAEAGRGGPGTTRQDRGAIARFVAARGPGLHHLALKVADIDATLARLDRSGLDLIDRMGRPGSRRARIGFIHPRSLGGILVHLVQREPA